MVDRRKLLAIHLCAPNDTNGNPRRVYVLHDRAGSIVAAIDEGYSGHHAVKEAGYPNAVMGPAYDTIPSEYRTLLAKSAPWRVVP